MNENSGITPNPLNPDSEPMDSEKNLDANPSESLQNEAETTSRPSLGQSIDGFMRPSEDHHEEHDVSPIEEEFLQEETVTTEESIQEPVHVQESVQEQTPIQTQSQIEPAPKKKSKTGLIIGIIVCLLVAVGCGVAVFLLNMNKGDVFAKAMNKLISTDAGFIGNLESDEMPSNLEITGTIDVKPMGTAASYSELKNISIDLDYKLSKRPVANYAKIKTNLDMDDTSSNVFVEAEGIYKKDSDLYFKFDDIDLGSLIQSLRPEEKSILNEMIDVWYMVPREEYLQTLDSSNDQAALECVGSLVEDGSKMTTELYYKYPFFVSSTENITIAKKNDPIYRITIDENYLKSFMKELVNYYNGTLIKEYSKCVNIDFSGSPLEFDESSISKIVDILPEFYVEIDNNYNITRFYMDGVIDNTLSIKADLSITYPDRINIDEPDEYTNIEELLKKIDAKNYLYYNNYNYRDCETVDKGGCIDDESVYYDSDILDYEEVDFE